MGVALDEMSKGQRDHSTNQVTLPVIADDVILDVVDVVGEFRAP